MEQPDTHVVWCARHIAAAKRAGLDMILLSGLLHVKMLDDAAFMRACGHDPANGKYADPRVVDAKLRSLGATCCFIGESDLVALFHRCGAMLQDLERARAEPVAMAHASIDHLIPVSRGGRHEYANVRLAHRRCNAIRGASWPFGSKLLATTPEPLPH